MADEILLSSTLAEKITSAANIKSVGENIQGKVGQSLIGFKGLAQDGSKESTPVFRVLERVRDLQQRTVDKMTEVWEVLKAQLDFEKDAARRERAKDPDFIGPPIPSETGEGGDLAKFGEDPEKPKKGFFGKLATVAAVTISTILWGGITALITGLAWAVVDGFRGSKVFGGVPGFIGGFFGGMNSGIRGMFAGMGKFALIGAGLGMVVPIFGPIVGGIIGALIGGIMGWIGGEKITAFINNIIVVLQEMFQNIVDKFVSVKEWVMDGISGFAEKIADMSKGIFDPIIWVLRKIQNGIKHMINFYIGLANKIPGVNIKKLEIDPVGDIGEERKEKEKQEATASALDKVQSAEGPERGTALNADEQKKMIATAEEFLSTNMDDLKTTLKDKSATGAYMETLNNLTLMAKEGAFGDKSEKLLSRLLKHQQIIKITAAEGAAELRAEGEEVPEHMTAIESGKTSGFDETKIVDPDKADKTRDTIASLEAKMESAIQSGEGKETIQTIQSDIDQEKKSLKKIEGKEDEKGWFGKTLATVLPGGEEGYAEGGLYKNFFKKFTSKKGGLVADAKDFATSPIITTSNVVNNATSKKSIGMNASNLNMTTRNKDFLYADVF